VGDNSNIRQVFSIVIAISLFVFVYGLYGTYEKLFLTIEHIGTFAAALFALMVINEMKNQQKTMDDELSELKKQTESTYLPYLMINESNYIVNSSFLNNNPVTLSKDGYSALWTLKRESLPDIFTPEGLSIQIENIGFKAAKKVHVTFGFSKNEFAKSFERIITRIRHIDVNKNYESMKDFGSDYIESEGNLIEVLNIDNKNRFSYILPVNDAKTDYFVVIPENYLRMCTIFYYLQNELEKIGESFIGGPPALEGVIEYETIMNKGKMIFFKIYLSGYNPKTGIIKGKISIGHMDYPDILEEECMYHSELFRKLYLYN